MTWRNFNACLALGLYFLCLASGHPVADYELDDTQLEFSDPVTREKKSYSSPTTICVEINPKTPYERSYMMCKEKRNFHTEAHRPHYFPYVGAPHFSREFRGKNVVPQKSTGYISPHNMKDDRDDFRPSNKAPHGLPVQPKHLQDDVHHGFGKSSGKSKVRTFDFDEAEDDFQVASFSKSRHGFDHEHHDHYEGGHHPDGVYIHHYYVPNKHSHGGYGGGDHYGDDYHHPGHHQSHSHYDQGQDYGHHDQSHGYSHGHHHGESYGNSYDHHPYEHHHGQYSNYRRSRPLSFLHIRPQLGPIVPHKTYHPSDSEDNYLDYFKQYYRHEPVHEASGPAQHVPAEFHQPSGPAQHVPAQFHQSSEPAHHAPAHGHHVPAPVYHAPAPVYHAPAPVYHAPAPVYHAPAPAYHAPAPVYHAPQSYHQAPAPVYYEPYAAPAPVHYGGYGCNAPPSHHYSSPAPSYGPPSAPCGQNYLFSCSPKVSPVGCDYQQKEYSDSLQSANPADMENKGSDKDKPPTSAIVVQPTHLSGEGHLTTTSPAPVVGAPVNEKDPSEKDQPKAPTPGNKKQETMAKLIDMMNSSGGQGSKSVPNARSTDTRQPLRVQSSEAKA